MSKLVNLPVAKVKDIPEHLRSFLKLDPNGDLPTIPMPSRQQITEASNRALFRYAGTPGIVTKPLTEKEKQQLTTAEVWAYNQCLKVQDIDCDFNTSKDFADRILGPAVQKTESIQVTGTIKDWQERFDTVVLEQTAKLEEAIRQQKEKHERAPAAS